MVTCYASISDLFARVQFYATFCNVVSESLEHHYATDAYKLFDNVCGDVWRRCKRNGDMKAWELFKTYCNRYLHEHGELASDRVCTFTWAGSVRCSP